MHVRGDNAGGEVDAARDALLLPGAVWWEERQVDAGGGGRVTGNSHMTTAASANTALPRQTMVAIR